MILPLGALLKKSFADFRLLLHSIMVGAVVLGLLLGLLSLQTQSSTTNNIGAYMENIGATEADVESVQQLSERIQRGDGEALEELQDMIGGVMAGAENTQPSPEVTAKMAGTLFTFMIFMWILTVVGSFYFLVVATGRHMKPAAALKETMQKFIPLVGLSAWIGIRSFLWIPFIGMIFGIVLMPRFLLAPVLLLKDGRGVMESVSLSYARTRGYWGKIMGNSIVALFCGSSVYVLFTIILGTLSSSVSLLIGLLGSILAQLLFAFFSVFTVTLAVTILENPIVKSGVTISPPQKEGS